MVGLCWGISRGRRRGRRAAAGNRSLAGYAETVEEKRLPGIAGQGSERRRGRGDSGERRQKVPPDGEAPSLPAMAAPFGLEIPGSCRGCRYRPRLRFSTDTGGAGNPGYRRDGAHRGGGNLLPRRKRTGCRNHERLSVPQSRKGGPPAGGYDLCNPPGASGIRRTARSPFGGSVAGRGAAGTAAGNVALGSYRSGTEKPARRANRSTLSYVDARRTR